MKHLVCSLTATHALWADWHLLTFDSPELARALRPGQFALARDTAGSTLDPYLRRQLWLYDSNDARVACLIHGRDPLAQRARVGDALDVLAPLGRAVTFEPGAQHILLFGQGSRTAQLVALAHDAVKLGKEVVVVTQGAIFPPHLLAPEIELRNEETFDAELIAWADAIVASGADAERFYRDLGNAVRAVRYGVEPGFARVLLETEMPCGTGLCYACAVDTARGVKLVCVDGPSFDLADWERKRYE